MKIDHDLVIHGKFRPVQRTFIEHRFRVHHGLVPVLALDADRKILPADPGKDIVAGLRVSRPTEAFSRLQGDAVGPVPGSKGKKAHRSQDPGHPGQYPDLCQNSSVRQVMICRQQQRGTQHRSQQGSEANSGPGCQGRRGGKRQAQTHCHQSLHHHNQQFCPAFFGFQNQKHQKSHCQRAHGAQAEGKQKAQRIQIQRRQRQLSGASFPGPDKAQTQQHPDAHHSCKHIGGLENRGDPNGFLQGSDTGITLGKKAQNFQHRATDQTGGYMVDADQGDHGTGHRQNRGQPAISGLLRSRQSQQHRQAQTAGQIAEALQGEFSRNAIEHGEAAQGRDQRKQQQMAVHSVAEFAQAQTADHQGQHHQTEGHALGRVWLIQAAQKEYRQGPQMGEPMGNPGFFSFYLSWDHGQSPFPGVFVSYPTL